MNRIRIFIVLALAVTVGGAFALATYRWQRTPATTVEKISDASGRRLRR
jgi:hypothetical protein